MVYKKLSEEDKIIIKHLRQKFGYGAKRIIKDDPEKNWGLCNVGYLLKKINETGDVKRGEGSGQWRRHGGDWGGTVPPTALSSHFCKSSKSDEKNLAVWGVTSSSIFGFLLNKVTKSIFFSQARLFYFNHLYD